MHFRVRQDSEVQIEQMLGGGKVKQIYSMLGEGKSLRAIARETMTSRNTVRKYVRNPGIPRPKPRRRKPSKLDRFKAYIEQRVSQGVDNCMVLMRELKAQGYTGGYTILKDYVKPFRQKRQPASTMRFETEPGEQAQVDWARLSYVTADGSRRAVWAFCMVLGWSRAMYVEFCEHADEEAFIRCHLHAFESLGIPRKVLYDNTKLVVLGRDEHGQSVWNRRFLDLALCLGFDPQLCRPYRAQTKGKVESGVKYIKRNFWPGVRFVDMDDLNLQARAWCEQVANQRLHGTTGERPAERLKSERLRLRQLPGWDRLAVFLRQRRRVGRDGYVRWQRSCYGVPCEWAGQLVEVQPTTYGIEIWRGESRLAVHPRATHPGCRFNVPGQWRAAASVTARPKPQPQAVQVPRLEVEQRPLSTYDQLVASGI